MTQNIFEDRRTFWLLAAIMLVLFLVTNLPWQLDDYDQAKQAWTSYEMVTEGHWFYQRTSDDQGLATKPPLTGWISATIFWIQPKWGGGSGLRLPVLGAVICFAFFCFSAGGYCDTFRLIVFF